MSTRSLWSIWFREMKPNVPVVFCNSSKAARARLTQEVLSQTQLRAWVMAGVSSEHLVMRLKLVEKPQAGMIDPGHLALVRIAEGLRFLQQTEHPRGLSTPVFYNK